MKALFRIAVLLACALTIIGCKSVQYMPVEHTHTDSIYITQHHRDSIYLHDSIHIRETADTVLIERWHTRWRERVVTDTLMVVQRDTIPQPYPVEVEVERRLTWWQQTRLHIANIVLIALAICAAWWLIRRRW